MKNRFVFGLFFFAVCSCQKEKEEQLTIVHIKTTHYLNGNPCPKVPFLIRETYIPSNHLLTDSTNDYGIYHTSFVRETDIEFSIDVIGENEKYFVLNGGVSIAAGEENNLEIMLIPEVDFVQVFDCSGSGEIKNYKRGLLNPITHPALQYDAQGMTISIEFPSCGNMFPNKIFSDTWVISYNYRPHIGAPWQLIADTVDVVPGDQFVHTIVY